MAERDTVTTPMRINWIIRLACHYSHRGEYSRAAQMMTNAQRIAEIEGLQVGLINRCWWGNFVSLHARDLARARHYAGLLEAATHITHEFKSGILHNIRCMIALADDAPAAGAEHGRIASRIAFDGGPAWSVAYFSIPTIFALLDIDAEAEALNMIERLRAFVTDTFISELEAELRLALAYRLLRRGEVGELFVCALNDALVFAQEKGYIFGFRCLFRAHQLLFDAAFRLGIQTDFLRDIVNRFHIKPGREAGESWPWPVKIHTLGRFQILIQDQPLLFGRKTPRKVLGVLKCIVAHGATQVPDHKIIDALWPEEDGAAAQHAFRIALHRLRKVLRSVESVLHEDGQISLTREIVWDDVAADTLAKSGTYSGKFAFFDDNGSATIIDKDRLIWHGVGQGLFFNDAGGGFLHLAIVVCPGRGLIDKGVVSFSGYCTATDKDGDKAVMEWRCDKTSPRCVGTAEWIGGTGKYAGMKGRTQFNAGGLGQATTGPVGYADWKGEWSLP